MTSIITALTERNNVEVAVMLDVIAAGNSFEVFCRLNMGFVKKILR